MVITVVLFSFIMMSSISGYPEFQPQYQRFCNEIIQRLEFFAIVCGFEKLDTSPVEKIETLLSKNNDSEIYGIQRINDKGKGFYPSLGLRFDLTLSMAKYIANCNGSMVFLYKRYQLGYVWRGDRPQKGRYRQFYQFDIDIITSEDDQIMHQVELLCMLSKMMKVTGLKNFVIVVNHKEIIVGILKEIGIDRDKIDGVIRVIDKSDKVDVDVLVKLLSNVIEDSEKITLILDFINSEGIVDADFRIVGKFARSDIFTNSVEGIKHLISIFDKVKDVDVKIVFSPKLARGLNYYTGFICEVKAHDGEKTFSM